MPALTAKQFAEPKGLKREKFPLGPWGWSENEYVWIRALSSRQLIDLQKQHGDRPAVDTIEDMAGFLGGALLDDEGNLLMENDAARTALLGQGLPLVNAMFRKLAELSGLKLEDDGKETELPN